MAVRVRDLEIALVLAREMKAAAERSVDASLRLDQLQEVFGVEELDSAERARIQTALQMAGLEPFPSLLDAEPSAPIRFGASKSAATAAAAAPPPAPPEETVHAETAPAFPTVGQFARSKVRSRRFGVRRGDHGEGDAPPPPPSVPPVETNGHVPDEAELDLPEEPVAEEPLIDEEEPAAGQEEVLDEPVAEEPVEEHEPGPEHAQEPEDEREYIPLAEPVAYEEPEPEFESAAPEPQPAGARLEEVVAVLLPAVAIPVIVTSIAGWRFGLPFVALTVIATGWVLGRRSNDGEKRGFFATLRNSPAALTALKVTAVVTVLSVAASIVLVAVRDSSSNDKKAAAPVKKPQQPTASTSVKPPSTTDNKKRSKRHLRKTTPPSSTSTTPAAPPADPATQGLIRVPPSSSGGAGGGTATTPGTGSTP
ncbi:MAG: hypothetical protein QOI19_1387 [Thermoleophilaceae bacterium]|nr:hypothetical protein [Thermoleophilaceae bacterium]